jgi:hypothetical protein
VSLRIGALEALVPPSIVLYGVGFGIMAGTVGLAAIESGLRSSMPAALGPVAAKGGPPAWAGLAAAILLLRLATAISSASSPPSRWWRWRGR